MKIQVSQYPCQQCQGQNFSELTEVYFKTKVVTFAFTLIPSEIIVIILSYCNSLRRENSLSSQLAIVKTRFSSTPFLSSIKQIQIDLISLFLRERERKKEGFVIFPRLISNSKSFKKSSCFSLLKRRYDQQTHAVLISFRQFKFIYVQLFISLPSLM